MTENEDKTKKPYFDQEAIASFVERSRKAQGLPAKVTDPIVLRRVAILMGADPTHPDPGLTEKRPPKSYRDGFRRNKSGEVLTDEVENSTMPITEDKPNRRRSQVSAATTLTFPTTIYINPKDVVVDEVYQRREDPRRVTRIAANFNEILFGIPLVSRRADGKIYCVDGQHRIAAAVMLGIDQIPVQILDSLTLAEEAWLWGAKNNTRKLHTSVEAFQGAFVSGSQAHSEIMEILNTLGLRLTKQKGDNSIAAAGMLLLIEHKGGVPLVRDTLTLIKTVWFTYPWAFDKRFLLGVASFFYTYEHIINWDDVVDAFTVALAANNTPHRILDRANEANPGVGTGERSMDVAQILKVLYNKYGHHKYVTVRKRPTTKDYAGFVKA